MVLDSIWGRTQWHGLYLLLLDMRLEPSHDPVENATIAVGWSVLVQDCASQICSLTLVSCLACEGRLHEGFVFWRSRDSGDRLHDADMDGDSRGSLHIGRQHASFEIFVRLTIHLESR